MPLPTKRIITALNLKWATADIKDEDGNVVLQRGQMKPVHAEWLEYAEYEGEPVKGTENKITMTITDFADHPEIKRVLGAALQQSQTENAALRVEKEQIKAEKEHLKMEKESLAQEMAEKNKKETVQ